MIEYILSSDSYQPQLCSFYSIQEEYNLLFVLYTEDSLLQLWLAMIMCLYRFLLFRVHPFFIHFIYFITLSMLLFQTLKNSKPRAHSYAWPTNIDLFFALVSASTLSGLSVIEVEVFFYDQLIITTILMLLDAQIFTSMVGIGFAQFNLPMLQSNTNSRNSPYSRTSEDQVKLGILSIYDLKSQNKNNQLQNGNMDTLNLKHNSIRYLGYVVLIYKYVSIL